MLTSERKSDCSNRFLSAKLCSPLMRVLFCEWKAIQELMRGKVSFLIILCLSSMTNKTCLSWCKSDKPQKQWIACNYSSKHQLHREEGDVGSSGGKNFFCSEGKLQTRALEGIFSEPRTASLARLESKVERQSCSGRRMLSGDLIHQNRGTHKLSRSCKEKQLLQEASQKDSNLKKNSLFMASNQKDFRFA